MTRWWGSRHGRLVTLLSTSAAWRMAHVPRTTTRPEKSDQIKPELDAHKTPESWATESAALARKAVYLDGVPLKARDDGDGVLQAPANYAPAAGRVARVQIGKAGKRLAEMVTMLIK
jgi:S1/P1 Nuclease